jgi:hypothetical protein
MATPDTTDEPEQATTVIREFIEKMNQARGGLRRGGAEPALFTT